VSKLLGLAIPERRKPNKHAFSIRPRKVEQWLDSLPKANLGETARQVYQVLKETNNLDFSHQDRTRFLERLRETVQYITDSMRKHFFGITYPLPKKNQKIAAATREIQMAMATGYKIAIEDVAGSNILFQDKKQLTLLIHRAISYISRVLLTSYQVYAPHPAGLWGELNKLYAFAENRKLTRSKVADIQLMYEEKSTIESEFLRTCLLWLASPYQLRQGESVKIYNFLERCVQYCDIQPLKAPNNPKVQGLFGVNIAQDAPPHIIHAPISESDSATYRVMNTDSLADRLRQDIQESEDVVTTTLSGIDMGRPDLSHDLLRRLLTAWGMESHRAFPRTSKKEHVQVSAGLSTIHQSLVEHHKASKLKANTHFEQQAEYQSSVIESVSDEKPDVWNMVYPTGSDVQLTQIVTEELGLQDEKTSRQQPPSQPPILDNLTSRQHTDTSAMDNWLIVNESANGCCLEYSDDQAAKAQVGELVGIRRRISAHSWKWGIGVIRWMKFDSKRELQLGIEMLNPNAAAIGMRIAASNRNSENYHRTLFLPDMPAIHQPATLITGPVPWRVGNKLVLNILGKDFQVELTRLVQNTGLFAQFQFEFLKDTPQEHRKRDEWLDEQDFGQVWSSI